MVHHSKQFSEHLLCKNTQKNVAQTRAQGMGRGGGGGGGEGEGGGGGGMTEGLDKAMRAILLVLHNGAGEPLMVE